MGRRIVSVAVLLALALATWGCGGGSDYFDQATMAKPTDIGDPSDWQMGVSDYGNSYFIVKVSVDAENRLYVLDNKVPYRGDFLQFDEDANRFFSKGREFRYDIQGNAKHTVKKGPNQGDPGFPMDQRVVEISPENGHVILYTYKKVEQEDRDDSRKGAYVVVP